MSEKDQLYVKIEGHQDLLQELKSVDRLVRNIEEADEVLEQTRGLKMKTIENIRQNVSELNDRIESIHTEMPQLGDEELAADISPGQDQEQEPEIDESVNELHNQLETLKSELEELE
jgi:DNA repair exonuclease SbcCD ATPase subunit